MNRIRLLPFLAASLLAVPACSGTGSSSGSGSGGTAGTAGTAGMTSTSGATAGTAATAGGSGSGSGSTTMTEPQPNGGQCNTDAECISEKCFILAGFGGICGECNSDADCPNGGCTIPNPLKDPAEGAVCNMGELGGGCMSTDVCQQGVCAEILDVAGLINISTCSVCDTDSECMNGQLCSPTIDVGELDGQKICVDPGTVADGEACDLNTTGNDACANFCESADVLGLAEIGVCSPCDVETGDGCNPGETCEAPVVDLDNGVLVPAMCVAGTGGTGG